MMDDFRSMWLDRIRRDASVTHVGFRVAYSIAADADHDGVRSARMIAFAAAAGTSLPSLSQAIDRLAGLGYLTVRRAGPGQQVRVKILRTTPNKAAAFK